MRKKSRQLAFCGVLCALAVVFLTLGSLVPMATFCCPILAMFALLPVQEEFGSGSALTAYASAAILSLLLVPDKEVALLFLFLGYYPILRLYLNRVPSRALRLLCALAVFNAAVLALYALLLYVFQLTAVVEDFSGLSCLMLATALFMGNLIFLLLDRVLGPLTLLYSVGCGPSCSLSSDAVLGLGIPPFLHKAKEKHLPHWQVFFFPGGGRGELSSRDSWRRLCLS